MRNDPVVEPRNALVLAIVVALAGLGPASSRAATAELVLERAAFSWSEALVLRVEGMDCPGGFAPPEVYFDDLAGTWTIDVDLLACDQSLSPPQPFRYDVPVGRLYPREYEVRIQDAIRHIVSPPPSPFDVARIAVHPSASLQIEPLGIATDQEPIRLALSGLASSSCFQLEGPFLADDGAYELLFLDNCPILPPGGPNVFREVRTLGPLPPGEYEVRLLQLGEVPDPTFFPPGWTRPMARRSVVVHDSARCVPGPETLCLNDGRFAATVTWSDYQDAEGSGRAVPLPGRDASGLFWFFGRRNVELTLKVLEGCEITGFWWVFLSSGSDVAFEVLVRDVETGTEWTYRNALGEAAPLIRDFRAFPCQ